MEKLKFRVIARQRSINHTPKSVHQVSRTKKNSPPLLRASQTGPWHNAASRGSERKSDTGAKKFYLIAHIDLGSEMACDGNLKHKNRNKVRNIVPPTIIMIMNQYKM